MLNGLKTALLLGSLTGVFLLVGHALGGSTGAAIALVLAGAMNFGAWYWSDRLVLRGYGAQEVLPGDAPGLHAIVARLAQRAGIPTPRVYVIPDGGLNAFATGRSPEHAAVAVTDGLLRALDREELEGVIAHELAHILNRDTLTATIAATLAGAVAHLAQLAIFLPIARGDDEEAPNPLAGLLMLILAPLAATIIQLAISRSREFAADATGARIAGSPDGLARALMKLERYAGARPVAADPQSAHLFIVSPLAGGGGGLGALFRTHPLTEERVRRLMQMR